jgi:hypothetical protein
MTPQERLKEIEECIADIRQDSIFSLPLKDCQWLVNRVKRLTEALEIISDGDNWKNECCACEPESLILKKQIGKYKYDSFLEFARKAREEE